MRASKTSPNVRKHDFVIAQIAAPHYVHIPITDVGHHKNRTWDSIMGIIF
jgi:hypothetical protein